MAGKGRSRDADSAFAAANEESRPVLASYLIRVTVRELRPMYRPGMEPNGNGDENSTTPKAMTNEEVEQAVEQAMTRSWTIVAARAERTDR